MLAIAQLRWQSSQHLKKIKLRWTLEYLSFFCSATT
jgi:hypothetical protein